MCKDEKKRCFESRIGQLENGIAVKVGCKLFVGTVDDIEDLVNYYSGKLTGRAKALNPKDAFIGNNPIGTGKLRNLDYAQYVPGFIDYKSGERTGLAKALNPKDAFIGNNPIGTGKQYVPGFIDYKSPDYSVINASNGWVVVKSDGAWMAKTASELLALIT